jgi:hypothetical protein
MFFSQNKPPLVFSEGVILDLIGYYGVFFARGFVGALAVVLAAAGFFAKVCFFFAGAAAGAGSGPNFTSGGSGTYGIGVMSGCGAGSILIGTGQPGCPG